MTLPTLVPGVKQFSSGLAVASKLDAFTRLSADDHKALAKLAHNTKYVDARRDLIAEGDKPRYVHLVMDGWGARYKSLPDGKRQIVSLLAPRSRAASTRSRGIMAMPSDIGNSMKGR